MNNISEIKQDSALYKEAIELRYQLFFKKHDLPIHILNDKKEKQSNHIVIANENVLIAYGRLSEIADRAFQVSQMVVSPTHQGQGYGKQLLLKILEIAQGKKANSIMLNARITAVSFYNKVGFETVGKEFNSTLTNVPHIKMIYHYKT